MTPAVSWDELKEEIAATVGPELIEQARLVLEKELEQTPGVAAAVTPAAERSSITLGELMAMTPEELDQVVIVEKAPIPGRPVIGKWGIGPV